ncbi:MAG: asparagine synthase (glutamine-hydrolyzing) [Ginsengibacter sp.]
MCGIAGIVKKNGDEVSEREIKVLTDIIAHRGPDDEGFYISGQLGLGHRRLSILDLSSAGHQPMIYNDLIITYNGEIYNYLELKKELESAGFHFQTHTDTEVIEAAYLFWGEDCVNHFNGMWSFVIYDPRKNILFCSRDRFGIKPFYYINNTEIFAFGSEIKQLHSLGYRKVNTKILVDYLFIGYENHSQETFFKDVFQLEPAHKLVYNIGTGEITIKQYYRLELKDNIKDLGLDESADLYASRINKAISLRLRSDVKVGTCLSGGLDSSYIASVAAKYYNEKSNNNFTSITAQSGDPMNDETKYAKMVVDSSNLDATFTRPAKNDISEDIRRIIYHQEEPFGGPSILMQYYVMKSAKESGCSVLLDGQGGDETLLGYERYYMSFLRNLRFGDSLRWFKKINEKSRLSLKEVVLYFFYFNFSFLRIYGLRRRIRGIRRKYKKCLNNQLIYEYAKSTRNTYDLQYLEITKTQLRHLLNYEDKNSMAWSVETRLPFLDFEALETAFSIKAKYKIYDGWSKYILRKVGEKVLPPEIAWRKNKVGFEAPKKFWNIDKDYEPLISNSKILNQIFKDISKAKNEKLRWKFLMIALWEREFDMEMED